MGILGLAVRGLRSFRVRKAIRQFHSDERGDEGVNKILIIAMVAIPLIVILIIFGGEIIDFFKGEWTELQDDEQMDEKDKWGGSEE